MEQKLYNALCKFMEFQTKDYVWYYDTPEKRFRWTPESIWLINPKTEKWVLELQKSGELWWFYDFYESFQRYFNMEIPDYEKFITIWVEDVLNRGVSTTSGGYQKDPDTVEDILNRGVSTTRCDQQRVDCGVEDILNRGVSTTFMRRASTPLTMIDVLNRGKIKQ